MNGRYYIAYGSNLSKAQMARRCPDASIVGTAMLSGWRLLFKKHATLEPHPTKQTPVLIWRISAEDEKSLDEYEDYPNYYIKKELDVDMVSIHDGNRKKIEGMMYLMADGHTLETPDSVYYKVISDGYLDFNFPMEVLLQALEDSIGKEYAAKFLEGLE